MTRLAMLAVVACSSAPPPPPPPAPPPVVGKLVSSAAWMGPVREIRAAGTQVPVAQIREIADLLGLPVSGTADVDVAIDVPNASPEQMTGHARVTCTACRIGDDHAKLMLFKGSRSAALAGDGLDVGHLDIDRLEVTADVANGGASLTHWRLVSPDVDLEISAHVRLASPLGASQVDGCIRFKPSPLLEKRDPKTFAVLSVTGAPLGDDGYYSIALEGRADAIRRLGKVCH